jgi:hypothetical protein
MNASLPLLIADIAGSYPDDRSLQRVTSHPVASDKVNQTADTPY